MPHSREGRRAIAEANRRRVWTEEQRQAVSKRMVGKRHAAGNKSPGFLGHRHSEGARLVISKAMMGNKHAIGNKNTGFLGHSHSEEARQQISRSAKAYWDTLPQEEKGEWARNVMKGNLRRPTYPELVVGALLEKHFPGEWAYNGDGNQGLVVGGRTPDFINVDGRKAVIEVFGSYWHGTEEVEPKIAHYNQYGFKCLVLWDYECIGSE